MTKRELLFYRRRREKILRMAKVMNQAEIARRLKLSTQRVSQIITRKNKWRTGL
jgi:DNA-directed RNA polymerase specialized sigma subunit